MSSSLLSEPSTVKLLPRDRSPLTANCPAEPTPGPTPGPATLPSVWGGGATPGNSSARSSNVLAKVAAPSGSVATSFHEKEPLCLASVLIRLLRISVSSTRGVGVGDDVAAVTPGVTGSSETGTGTTSPV